MSENIVNHLENEDVDDDTCRLFMTERSDVAGITSAYLENSSIIGLR
jgi:hypothetical protein